MAGKQAEEASSGTISKTDAVKAALEEGMTSPNEISAHVKKKHGLDVTPAYVSTIKGNLKEKPVNGRKKPGPKPGQKKAVQAEASRGLSARDLGALADLAQRAGGLDKLEEYLSALRRVR
jgi:hypothetical protein